MRSETDELEHVSVGQPVDEDQVRLDMAIAVICPGATQSMIAVLGVQRPVVCKGLDEGGYTGLDRLAMLHFFLAFRSRLNCLITSIVLIVVSHQFGHRVEALAAPCPRLAHGSDGRLVRREQLERNGLVSGDPR